MNMKLEELKKYNVITFSVTLYSENNLWVTSKQSVANKQADNSISHSTIDHQFKATSLENALEILEGRARKFYYALKDSHDGK